MTDRIATGKGKRNTNKQWHQTTILMNNVRAKRERLNMSARRLAEDIRVSYSTICRLERGIGEPEAWVRESLSMWVGDDFDKNRLPPKRKESRLDALEERMERVERLLDATESRVASVDWRLRDIGART